LLDSPKALAITALTLITNGEKLKEIKNEFETQRMKVF
jgi:hypothetical protein